MKEDFIIPLNGLAEGRSCFSVHAGKEFFEAFGNSEIVDADVDVKVSVEKSGRYTGLDLVLSGTLTVPCDRCLEDLVLPVEAAPRFSVKFGAAPESEDSLEEGEREIIFLPESDSEFDLSQIIYDFSCISLPVKRVHPDGLCNPDTVRFLNAGPEEPQKGENSPFTALKELFDKK